MKLKLRTGILAVLGIMLIFSVPLMANTEEETVEFVDRKLELAVRSEANKAVGDLYPSDLKKVEYLKVSSKVTSLKGIGYCKNLEHLYLYQSNKISDLSPLAGLSQLKTLHLVMNNDNLELSTLPDLKNLQVLYLTSNNIVNISPLSALTSLERLHLASNKIQNLKPLTNLSNLEYLDLRFNKISDISALTNLLNLQRVRLTGNNISDLQPLIDNYKIKENGEKVGLGEGDKVEVSSNNLDLSKGSKDLQDIQTLMDRGVDVDYSKVVIS